LLGRPYNTKREEQNACKFFGGKPEVKIHLRKKAYKFFREKLEVKIHLRRKACKFF
jgi:hypothetical protein